MKFFKIHWVLSLEIDVYLPIPWPKCSGKIFVRIVMFTYLEVILTEVMGCLLLDLLLSLEDELGTGSLSSVFHLRWVITSSRK